MDLLLQLLELYGVILQLLVGQVLANWATARRVDMLFVAVESAECPMLLLKPGVGVRSRILVRYCHKLGAVEVRRKLNAPLLLIEVSLNNEWPRTEIFQLRRSALVRLGLHGLAEILRPRTSPLYRKKKRLFPISWGQLRARPGVLMMLASFLAGAFRSPNIDVVISLCHGRGSRALNASYRRHSRPLVIHAPNPVFATAATSHRVVRTLVYSTPGHSRLVLYSISNSIFLSLFVSYRSPTLIYLIYVNL